MEPESNNLVGVDAEQDDRALHDAALEPSHRNPPAAAHGDEQFRERLGLFEGQVGLRHPGGAQGGEKDPERHRLSFL